MKITPLEIRQKAFEKKLRGYDKDEVNAFLLSLSQEWENMVEEAKNLKMELERSQKDVERLREVESSLFKTLKTAEDTGANVIDQANKTAELQLREAQMKAEAILNDAKSQAREMLEDAEEKAATIIDDMQYEVRQLQDDYKNIETHRDNLLMQLKSFANEILERVQRVDVQSKAVSEKVKESREVKVEKKPLPSIEEKKEKKPEETPRQNTEEKPRDTRQVEFDLTSRRQESNPEEKPSEDNKDADEPKGGSFFDQL